MLAYLAVIAALAIPSNAVILFAPDYGTCVIPGTGNGAPEQPPPKDGTPAFHRACGNNANQEWELIDGETMVKWQEGGFCLDAGEDMAEGAVVELRACHAGLPQQTWWYTDDGRIALKDSGKCLTAPVDPQPITNGPERFKLTLTTCKDNDKTQYFEALDKSVFRGELKAEGRGDSGVSWKKWTEGAQEKKQKRRLGQ